MAEVRRIFGIGRRRRRVRVMQRIKSQSAEDDYDDESSLRRGLSGEYGCGFCRRRLNHFSVISRITEHTRVRNEERKE